MPKPNAEEEDEIEEEDSLCVGDVSSEEEAAPEPSRQRGFRAQTKPKPAAGESGSAIAIHRVSTLGFFIHGFWAGRKSPILGVWAAPAAAKTIPEGGGASPPPSGSFFWAAGAAQTPKINDFRAAQRPSIKNTSVGPFCDVLHHECLDSLYVDSSQRRARGGHPTD